MGTTPSLSHSPSSPPNSQTLSEASSPDYHSPYLVDRQHNISPPYGTGSFCSMASDQDSDTPLFALEAGIQYSAWDHPTTTLVPHTSTSTSISTVLPLDHGPFESFTHPIPATYSPGYYAGGPPRPESLPATHSQRATGSRAATIPESRSPHMYAMPPPMLPSSTTAVFQAEMISPAPVFGRMGYGSQFLPARSAPFPRPTNPHNAYSMDGNSETSGRFLSENCLSGWGGSASVTEPLYPAAASSQVQQLPGLAQNQQQRGGQPRRQPRHLTTKEEANFQCEVRSCGKLFSRSYNYKAHMETHDEKREYPFPCQVPDCDKRFVRKTDLQRHHQSVHMKERSHKCDYCGRLFSRKDTLRRHMDDGCSRRFDIGTLDLSAEGLGGAGSSSQDQAWRVQ